MIKLSHHTTAVYVKLLKLFENWHDALLQNYKVNRDGFKPVFDEDMPENVISWFKRLLAEVTGKLRPPFL